MIKYFPFLSLRARLLILVFTSLLPALILLFYSASEQKNDAEAEIRANTFQLVKNASAQIEQLAEGSRQFLSAFSELPSVLNYDSNACNASFSNFKKNLPMYRSFFAVKPNGDLFCSALPVEGKLNVADRHWFLRILETRSYNFGEYHIGRISSKPTICAGIPVIDKRGQLKAVVAAAFDLSSFNEQLSKIKIPTKASIIVIDREGTILSRYPNPEGWIGKKVLETGLVKTILAKKEGTVEAEGLEGHKRIFSFVSVKGTGDGMYVCFGISPEAAFSSVNRKLLKNMLWLFITAVLASAAAWFGGDIFILRRMKELTNATNELASGNLSARVDISDNRDEIAQLGRSFNKMAMALDQIDYELRASGTKFKTIFNNAGDAIFICDLQGNMLEVNSVACGRLGYNRDELMRMRPVDIYTPENASLVFERIERLNDNSTFVFETAQVRHDGTVVPTEVNARIIEFEGKQAVMGICRDITDRKMAEKALKEAHAGLEHRVEERTVELSNLNDQLREEIEMRKRTEQELTELANELKLSNTNLKNFTHVISHDLKSPLITIGGFVNLLTRRYKGKLDAGADEILNDIGKGVDRMLDLIRDLLDYSQAKTKKQQFKPVDCASAVREAILNLNALIKANDAVLTYDDLPTVSADEPQIISLFQNLIDNAVKYRSGEAPSILISAEQKGTEWLFSIQDNGIGIDSKGLERIFGMFQRLSTDQPGTGIGLATCKEIVERHGGRIWATPNPAGGSTFYFTIPVDNAVPVAQKPDSPQ